MRRPTGRFTLENHVAKGIFCQEFRQFVCLAAFAAATKQSPERFMAFPALLRCFCRGPKRLFFLIVLPLPASMADRCSQPHCRSQDHASRRAHALVLRSGLSVTGYAQPPKVGDAGRSPSIRTACFLKATECYPRSPLPKTRSESKARWRKIAQRQ